MCEDVRLQVGGLRKLFVAAVKGAHVRAVSSVNAYMCAQVKVQWEAFATALERALENERRRLVLLHNSLNISIAGILRNNNRVYFQLCQRASRFFHTPAWASVWRGSTHLERFLPSVNELMPLQLWTFHESLAALSADVHTRTVGVQMLPHCRVIPEHLGASLIRTEMELGALLRTDLHFTVQLSVRCEFYLFFLSFYFCFHIKKV